MEGTTHGRRGPGEEPGPAAELVAERLDLLVRAAGSKLALASGSGVSEGTVRNWHGGQYAASYGTRTARKLDEWGRREIPGYPPPDRGGPTLEALVALVAREQAERAARVSGVSGVSGATAGEVAPDASGDEEPAAPGAARTQRGWRRGYLLATAAVLVVAVAGALTLLLGPGRDSTEDDAGDGGEEAPSSSSPLRAQTSLVLDAGNMCAWTLGERPIPLASVDPLVMRIDARCNYPQNPDPDEDPGASVYSVPSNDDPTLRVGRIRNNNTFVPLCFVPDGDQVSDGGEQPNVSRVWLKVQDPAGFVPDVNVGGGYSLDQLRQLGLVEC